MSVLAWCVTTMSKEPVNKGEYFKICIHGFMLQCSGAIRAESGADVRECQMLKPASPWMVDLHTSSDLSFLG